MSALAPTGNTPLIGLRLKQLVLLFGGPYLAMVCVTNLVNLAATITDGHWAFLNSGNADSIRSIVKHYSWPNWFDDLAVLGAAAIEGIGAVLFARALLRFKVSGVDAPSEIAGTGSADHLDCRAG